MTIVTIGLCAGIGSMGSSSAHSNHTQNIDRAFAAIQDKLEDFQAYTYDELFNSPTGSTVGRFGSGDTLYFAVSGLPGPFNEYGVASGQTLPMKVQKVAENGTTLKRVLIRFTVSWTDSLGPATIETFYHYTARR